MDAEEAGSVCGKSWKCARKGLEVCAEEPGSARGTNGFGQVVFFFFLQDINGCNYMQYKPLRQYGQVKGISKKVKNSSFGPPAKKNLQGNLELISLNNFM